MEQLLEADRSSDDVDGLVQLSGLDQRHLRWARALRAEELHSAPLLAERLDIYNRYGRQVIWTVAKRYSDLMPLCNGEFEFLTLLSAMLIDSEMDVVEELAPQPSASLVSSPRSGGASLATSPSKQPPQ